MFVREAREEKEGELAKVRQMLDCYPLQGRERSIGHYGEGSRHAGAKLK